MLCVALVAGYNDQRQQLGDPDDDAGLDVDDAEERLKWRWRRRRCLRRGTRLQAVPGVGGCVKYRGIR